MANQNAFKNHIVPIKCVVTRIDDPATLNRVQVYIPSVHGAMDESSKGRGDNPGIYPWAQMCTTLFKDNNNATVASMQELFAGGVPVLLPPVGTIGWVLFEGGDLRTPIYMGSLSKGEANEYVSSIYTGSDNQNLSVGINATSQLDIMMNVIFDQESNRAYDAVNPKDGPDSAGHTCISIGLLQWFYTRAQNLLQKIREANTIKFDQICLTHGCNLNTAIYGNFDGYTCKTGDFIYLTLKDILRTSESKQVQDDLVKTDLSAYVDKANELGVTSFDAQIYFCDMYNQAPSDAVAITKSTNNRTLDGLHSACLNSSYKLGTTYKDRRVNVYNTIKQLEANGQLYPTTSTNLNGTSTLGLSLKYPTESKDIIETYKATHQYVTIASEAYADAVAPMPGNAYFSKKSPVDGWYVEITNGKYIIRLCNLADYVEGHETTKDVEAGEKIGRVGYSSTWTPCLPVKFKINGVPTDPVPYFSDVSTMGNGVVETAINWMLNIANDNDNHGYSQTSRKGPDYDCASLCTHGYINAGLPINPDTYTGDMKQNFTAVGFTAIPYTSGMTLVRGDVLFWHYSGNKGHAVCYIGDGQIVSAHSNKDGKPGDSSGAEIDVGAFYDTHWQWVLRYNV